MNSNIEGFKVFLIPDNKREEYFSFVDDIKKRIRYISEENWNTYDDPLIQINMSTFSKPACELIEIFMKKIGAKDVTEIIKLNQ